MAILNFMRDYIRLQDVYTNTFYYINPKNIFAIEEGSRGTKVNTMVGAKEEIYGYFVEETPEQIAELVEKLIEDTNELDEKNFDDQQEVLLRRAKKTLEYQKQIKTLQAAEQVLQ